MTVAISPAPQLGNSAWIHPVFVAEGQVVQQVVDGVDALGPQHVRQAGTNALHDTERKWWVPASEENVSRRSGVAFGRCSQFRGRSDDKAIANCQPAHVEDLTNFVQSLAAVLAGNAAYFLLMPYLPPAARHVPFQTDLGSGVDAFFCLVALGHQ